ncbi:hypothetical protein shim_19040 [Shimia sp. SK013]|uniref:hypothetical protein n=1 Tax=Shimia sp. SK013 TaxID=1389006 RepID=UPI0006B57E51|nr:hypothetical protein [Shimia sp. SK013]KPA22018.1 hypothetical protein shim_19040 [Shimia sp. SK013]
MSPSLALTLSFEGIGLLTRVDGGWHLLGEVGLDSDDLAGELAKLHDVAAVRAGVDFATLLVLPNDQIKVLSLDLGRLSASKQQTEIVRILEEQTPYGADQLVFDSRVVNGQTQVAAVARETLAEAEAFAAEHQFNPVRFAAMPDPAMFGGTPDFGPTQGAKDPHVDHDGAPMVVVGSGPLPDKRPAPTEDVPQEDAHATAAAPEVAEPPEPSTSEDIEAAPEARVPMSFSSRRQGDTTSGAPELGGASRDPGVAGTNALDVGAARATTEPKLRFDPARVVAGLKSDDGADDGAETSDTPSGVASGMFRSRNKSSESGTKKKAAKTKAAKKSKKPADKALQAHSTAEAATAASDTLVADLPEPARSRRGDRRKAVSQEKEKLTVFGSRKNEVRGKPRHLGLILMTLLLAFLAGVAVWATYFLDDGVAGLFGKSDTEIVVLEPQASQPVTPAPIQTPTPSPAADVPQIDAPRPQPEIEIAAVDPTDGVDTEALPPSAAETITDSAEIEAMLDGIDPLDLTDSEAEARYAVTGIWQKAPLPPLDVNSESVNDIYTPSIDLELGALDAIALPAPGGLNTDAAPAAQSNPPIAGTQFDFDARGLVVATADGALSPDGILVFAGRPSVEPPAYPKRIIVATALAAQTEDRLATRRPRVRPFDLLESNQRATLGGLTLNELGRIRPTPRPPNQKAEAEADTTPTALAVATSLRPRAKPANIAQLAQRQTPSLTTSVEAVPASAAIAPTIPTTASVARQATIQNAINLRKINLIGVYGTSSNRRALVRLSNGRYKKVQVGDRIDGGKVAAIDETELRYIKSGKNIILKMPKG